MKTVLVLGAGKSATVLIETLLADAVTHDWRVIVGDLDPEVAARKVGGHPRGEARFFDVHDASLRRRCVEEADLVVSLLPAFLHPLVADDCVAAGVHFCSASYVSPEMSALHAQAAERGVTLVNEMGVDPGIDHMSAMAELDRLRGLGARITAFETFTGGLVAPESEDNPWKYKFTWNPRNVVLAGQGVVQFKHNGRLKYIPYHRLFGRYEVLHIPGYGAFEGYANRDSLKYRRHYGLYDVDTLYRGTLRRPGFCKAWDALVQLGLTDDTYELEGLEGMTWRRYVNSYLWYDPSMSVELKLQAYLKLEMNSQVLHKLSWLGLFEDEPIGLTRGTPAQVLQHLLEQRWTMSPADKDMVAMLHKTTYELDGKRSLVQSSMVCLGDGGEHTAMAKTVGLPLAIAARLVLLGGITRRGVVIPTVPDVYEPILEELAGKGIVFEHQVLPAGSP